MHFAPAKCVFLLKELFAGANGFSFPACDLRLENKAYLPVRDKIETMRNGFRLVPDESCRVPDNFGIVRNKADGLPVNEKHALPDPAEIHGASFKTAVEKHLLRV